MRNKAHKTDYAGRHSVSPSHFLILLLSYLFILSSSHFLISCSVELPSHVISERKMENILYDYHIAQGMAEAQGGDVEANRYIFVQKVFEKHHVTEAQFDTSMVWYMGHADHLEEMYKRIEARLERTSSEAGLNIPDEDKFARFTAEGDTANIWQGREMIFLFANRESNLYTIVMPADTSFHKGDYFMLRCTSRFISQDGRREGFVMMQVKYDNDSVVASSTMVSGDRDVRIEIPEQRVRKDHDVKSVTCTFYHYFDEGGEPAFRVWALSKPVLLRYHNKQQDVAPADEPTDSLENDTLPQPAVEKVRMERRSPEEFRAGQQVERKIEVVQKRGASPKTRAKRRTNIVR